VCLINKNNIILINKNNRCEKGGNMVKLMQLKNGQFIVTIPKIVVESKKWRKGDNVEWSFNELGQLILKSK